MKKIDFVFQEDYETLLIIDEIKGVRQKFDANHFYEWADEYILHFNEGKNFRQVVRDELVMAWDIERWYSFIEVRGVLRAFYGERFIDGQKTLFIANKKGERIIEIEKDQSHDWYNIKNLLTGEMGTTISQSVLFSVNERLENKVVTLRKRKPSFSNENRFFYGKLARTKEQRDYIFQPTKAERAKQEQSKQL